ncbi:LON peptidase substrate-binding domain-containing protein [Acidithiobacillus sp. IBUN Pt1247-S3]|uniref:LON peptidase substrate-binding domain-containing protein n=1 Tax=Acidithiobacillus sp. IBUN Pt1247-S3 TaxID=3166642 RepID=UPI0034E51F8E
MTAQGDAQEWYDLFLLSSVLFPNARLGLRIFEPRYFDMVSRSMRSGKPFGICLAEADAAPVQVGTLAKIIDWNSENGLLLLDIEGMQRFTVQEWQHAHDVTVARIHLWPEEPTLPIAFEHDWLKPILQQITEDPNAGNLDASRASMVLAQALPIRATEKQQLLLLQDPLERLRRIATILHKKASG